MSCASSCHVFDFGVFNFDTCLIQVILNDDGTCCLAQLKCFVPFSMLCGVSLSDTAFAWCLVVVILSEIFFK